MVRCKMMCVEKGVTAYGPGDENKNAKIVLSPVTGGSEENKKFFKWTPSGRIELGVVNAEAAALFEPGKEYYIDFTPAE